VLRVLVARLGTGDRRPGSPRAGQFAGTSNVLYAMKLGVTPLGTMAHEYLQACQALGPRLRDSQVFGFEMWAKEYRGDLGIALSDVYGMSAFLRDFDLYFCKLFDGARHDSGDPFAWGERLLEHYRTNRVDPLTKTLIFSDGLTIAAHHRAVQAVPWALPAGVWHWHQPYQRPGRPTRARAAAGRHQDDALQRPAGGQAVRHPGKGMCDDEKYLAYLRQVFDIPARCPVKPQ
jgi:nicotinate phosphoribosyltransferase